MRIWLQVTATAQALVSSILPPTSAISGYTIKGELLISPCICLPQQPAHLTSAIAGYGTEAEPLTSPCICLPKLPASLTSAIFGYAVQRELLIYPHICLPKLPARLTSAIAGYVAETSLTSAIAGYVAEASLTSAIAGYVAEASLTAAIAGYVAETSLTSAKAGYVVEVELLICPCICLPKLLACLMLSALYNGCNIFQTILFNCWGPWEAICVLCATCFKCSTNHWLKISWFTHSSQVYW